MDARPKTRQVDRERKTPSTQVPRGAKQIVVPIIPAAVATIFALMPIASGASSSNAAPVAPELFPAGFDQGYCLHGFGRESLKLSGLKLRKIVLANGASYWLRPSFIFSYMTGTVDQLAYPLLLAAHGVPFWLLTLGFGHNDMFWYRLIERRGETVWWEPPSTTRPSCPRIGGGRASADWAGQKGYVATTVGEGCVLGVGLTASADDAHLQEAYGVFAAEARDVEPEYARDGQHRRLGVDAECVPDVVSPDHGGALFSARVLEDSRPLPQGPRTAPPGVGRLPCRLCEGVSTPDERVSAVVCNANLDRLGARDADEAVEQDGVLRGGLFPSGMPSHEQRGGSSHEPAVPTDVCKPGPARPSRLVRVTVTGLGLAVELSPLRPSEQPTPHPRQSRPSTQRQTLS